MGLLWVIFCIVVGYYANERGRNPWGWGLLAVVISPLLAGIALAVAKDLSIEEDMDELNKTTENIKREVEHNKEFNDLHREVTGNSRERISGYRNSNELLHNAPEEALTGEIECQECGVYVSPDNKFCPECGSKIIPQGKRECPSCGGIIDKEKKYCSLCGQKLKRECPACDQELALDTNFCPQCGNQMADRL